MASQATRSGIVTDENSGERHIPESVRADGSTRKAIKIRPGYRPPEDVEVFKNRPAEAFRERGKRIGIPGAAGLEDEQPEQILSASNRNARRREARKKAKAAADGQDAGAAQSPQEAQPPNTEEAEREVEQEKRARNLKKKLRQARDLQSKRDGGETLLPEQIAKVIKIKELIRELDGLGFNSDGEPKATSGESLTKDGGSDGKD